MIGPYLSIDQCRCATVAVSLGQKIPKNVIAGEELRLSTSCSVTASLKLEQESMVTLRPFLLEMVILYFFTEPCTGSPVLKSFETFGDS